MGEEFDELSVNINEKVTVDSLVDVDKITIDIVKLAMSHIKDGKKDVL